MVPLDRVAALPPRTRLGLAVGVITTTFLGSLDSTVVGTALPRVVSQLGADYRYTWVITAYLLTSTVTVPLCGRFSGLYGRTPARQQAAG